MNDLTPENPSGEFLLYQTEEGQARVECRVQGETLWLSRALIANLKNYTKYLQAHTGKVSLLTKKSVKESCKRILTKAKKVSAYPPSLSTMLNSGGFFCV